MTNNYLNHRRPQMLVLSETERYENVVQGCVGADQAAFGVRNEVAAVSRADDASLSGDGRDGLALTLMSWRARQCAGVALKIV